MDLNEMNENWQKEAPTLAAVEKANLYTVPDGYFSEMEERLKSQINISRFDNDQPLFMVPEGYFDTLADQIISATRLEQLKDNNKTGVFTVPENYFTDLEERIKTKLEPQEHKSSKPTVRKLFTSWATYAAAACITAIISFGVYFSSTTGHKDIESQIANIPAEEIVNYLQLYSDAGDAPIIMESLEDEASLSQIGSDVSEQEIEQYLKLNL